MINRYDRIDLVRAQNALIHVCALGKNRRHRYERTNNDPCPCSRARGSNRFKPIRIRITLNRFHVRCTPRGKIVPGGPLTARGPTHIIPISLLFFSDRHLVSRAPSSDHTRRSAMKNLTRGKTLVGVRAYVETTTQRVRR